MNGITILLWITIFIVGVIAIILVKLRFKGDELEKDENSIISLNSIGEILPKRQNDSSNTLNSPRRDYSQPTIDNTNYIEEVIHDENIQIEPEVENNNYNNVEYESQNQVLINYENEVKKLQEPMNEYQVEIMTPDNNEKHELKDLFTIDELIKESKRKDSEREKEAQRINEDEDEELTELKESIRRRKENENVDDKLIEEIMADEEISELLTGDSSKEETKVETIKDIIENEDAKEETIKDIVENEETEPAEESVQDILNVETPEETAKDENEIPLVASQKEIEEAITNASQEIKEEEPESLSQDTNITDALLNSQDSASEIKEPVLKSPTKINEIDDIGSSIDNSTSTSEMNDLDYRKDLAKITNKIKGSSIFKEVKEKLSSEPEEELYPLEDFEENYIRNVNDYEEYDEYAPIINETHDEFGETYEPDYDEAIRQENTRKLFKNTQTPEPQKVESQITPIKSKPERGNIKIQLNNREAVLKKGNEIIFKHDGETYSSQVYAINGDEISVKYRGKHIKIKPEDVKKIY